MANESQYYNPIVQAMIATAQQGNEKARTEIEQKQQQAAQKQAENEQKLRESQFEQLKTQQEREHDIQLKELEQHQQMLGGALGLQQTEALKNLQDFHHGGGDLSQIAPQLLARFGVPAMGSQPNFAPGNSLSQNLAPTPDYNSMFGSPEQHVAMIRAAAAAQSGGQAEGALPSQLSLSAAKAQQELALQQNAQQFESSEANKKIASSEKIAGMSKNTQLGIANMENATRLQLGQWEYQPSPDTTRSMILGAGTGQYALNMGNPQERAAATAMSNQGWRQIPKNDVEALKQTQSMGPLVSKMSTFIDKYLPDTQVGGAAQKLGMGVAEHVGWTTNTQNEADQIDSQLVNAGKIIEGLTGGRITNTQIKLAGDAVVQPGLTKDQAKARLANFQDLLNNKITNTLMGGVPKDQQEALYKTQGIRPAWLLTAPKKNTAGHVLDEDKSIELGQPVYKSAAGGK